jgi:hypothetical protein
MPRDAGRDSPARGRSIIRFVVPFAVLAALTSPACAADAPPARSASQRSVIMSAAELFAFADKARDRGDFATAEAAYRALAANPDPDLRSEARFRLGMMLADGMKKYREAAVEFRKILDEKPHAARVRLELARMQAMLGNLGSAERELRAAEAAGLPPQVERLVRFYANALSARKPFGGSFELALAPDSNINRATRSDTLGTVGGGDLTLSKDAKARSGVGLEMRGQAYGRIGIQPNTSLLVRLSASTDFYRASMFDDWAVGIQAGPEYTSGVDRITLSVGPSWRWYGEKPYSFGVGGSAAWQHPMGKRAQLRLEGGISYIDNRFNDLQDATDYTLSAALDRAFSDRFGGGVQVFASREAARDPGYATTSGGLTAYAFREVGRTTVVVSADYSHLEADKPLFLFPGLSLSRRVENRFGASVAGTFRSLRVGSFAPLARLRWERNKSTVGLYDYKRITGEFGITSAF